MSEKENENLKNDVCNQDLGSESPKKDEWRDEDAQKDQLHAVGNFPTNALILNLKKIFVWKYQLLLIILSAKLLVTRLIFLQRTLFSLRLE